MRTAHVIAAFGTLHLTLLYCGLGFAADGERRVKEAAAASPAEARGRARLLHETIHGVLQVMHRDFFDDDNPAAIPSASLEDVFHELERSHGVTARWLVVDTDVVNVDHRPEDEFERRAVGALKAGKPDYEQVAKGRYRFAGPIRLGSECLKCHVKNRTRTDDRTAGLTISIPVALGEPKQNDPSTPSIRQP